VCALKAIKALDEAVLQWKYVVNMIFGRPTPQITMYRHEGLDVFASGSEKEPHFWNSLIRQMLLEGLLQKDIEEYGVLKFTKKGTDFLKKPKSFKSFLITHMRRPTLTMMKAQKLPKVLQRMKNCLRC
jgi:ATP-dependent DNA helicase RecQ